MRVNLLIRVFSLMLVPLSVSAQCMDSVWTIGPGSENTDLGSAVTLANNGNAVIAGYYNYTGIDQGVGWLIKVDPENGNQIWSRTYPADSAQGIFLDVSTTTDGGFICGGWLRTPPTNDQQFWLYRVNADGDSLWSRSFGHDFANQARAVVQAPDGGYAIAGRGVQLPGGIGQYDWWIVKTDSTGDSVWSRIIGGPLEDTCLDLILTPDGNFLLVGWSTTDSTREGRLTKIGLDGEILWDRTYDFEVSIVLESALAVPGGFLVCGYQHGVNEYDDVMLMEVDEDGQLQWHRRYSLAEVRSEYATALCSDGGDGYYVFGHAHHTNTAEKDAFVLHVAACGEIVRTTWLGNAVDEEIWDGIKTPDGMLVTAGVARLSSAQLELQGFGIRPDTCNMPPCSFARVMPIDSSQVETTDSVRFSWTAAVDPDGAPVNYMFHVESNYSPFQPLDTVIADTFIWVNVPLPVEPLDVLFDFHWQVRATDGIDTVSAVNGDGYFSMDIPQNIEPTAVQPFDFGLSAYPNPFNAATTIALALPQTNHVTLLLYDIQGRLVKTLADGTFSAGTHDISLDFTNRPSGIYFAEMRTPIRSRIVKLVVLK